MDWHLRRYIRLRHRYLSAGGELNIWRTKIFEEMPHANSGTGQRTIIQRFVKQAKSNPAFVIRFRRKLFRLELFKDERPEQVRRGLLSRVATLRRDETAKAIHIAEDVPLNESRSCL